MSLVSEMSPADIAAVTGNNGSNGWGGDGAFWIIVLFLFAAMGGWGGNFGGGNGAVPYMMNSYTNNDVQRGFDQAAIMGGNSYRNGNSYGGRYSRRGGRRHDDREEILDRLDYLMENSGTEQERQAIRQALNTLENM